MTMAQASEKYQIPIEILQEYEKWNLRGEAKVKGEWQYNDEDLERLGMIMTLQNTGFDNKETESYMRLYLKGEETAIERMQILKQKRDQTLEEIHLQEKRLENIDYLRYKIRSHIK